MIGRVDAKFAFQGPPSSANLVGGSVIQLCTMPRSRLLRTDANCYLQTVPKVLMALRVPDRWLGEETMIGMDFISFLILLIISVGSAGSYTTGLATTSLPDFGRSAPRR